MKAFALFAINLLLLISALPAPAQETNPKLTNEDVVKMVQAGLSTDQIVSKIKKSGISLCTTWDQDKVLHRGLTQSRVSV